MTEYREIDGYLYQVTRQENGHCSLKCVGIVNQLIPPSSLEITGKEDFNGIFEGGWTIVMLPGQKLIDDEKEAKQMLQGKVKSCNASLSGRFQGEKDPDAIPLYTPSANWRVTGEEDPHKGRYECQRAELSMGHLSDDELANGAFMNYDRPIDIGKLMERTPGYYPPITWMTAAKDRIRWLSRSLEKAISDQTEAINETISAIREDVGRLENKKTYNDKDVGYNKAIGHVCERLKKYIKS